MRRPTDPGFVFGVLSAALIVLLASVALTEAAPAPPAIAEFAPQAVEQIKESPAELQAAFGGEGRGGGGSGGDVAATTTTTTKAAATDPSVVEEDPAPETVPRTRRCIGDPPRQTEDPQSPPCVPYWIGDNGGATAKGVTATEVRIAVAAWQEQNDPDTELVRNTLIPFFNERFEFYGRRLVLVPVGPSSAPSGSGAEYQAQLRAIAAEADEKNVFAGFGITGQDVGAYARELQRRGILFVGPAGRGGFDTPAEAERAAPYAWSYDVPLDTRVRGLAEWACKQLVGRPAAFAKNERRGLPRRFAVLYAKQTVSTYDPVAEFDRTIRACGGPPIVEASAPQWTAGNAASPEQNSYYRTNTAKVCDPSQAVTTVVDFTTQVDLWLYQQAFSQQGCFPEWLVDGFGVTDNNPVFQQSSQAEQRNGSLFGLSWRNKQIPFVDEPSYQALKESNPNFQYDPSSTQPGASEGRTRRVYQDFILLASGVQTAGPRLTPATFEAGLHRTVFPNPDHPNRAAKVDFTDGDYVMVDDAVEIWWSEEGLDPTLNNPGAHCYIAGGAVRYRLGRFPEQPSPFFQPPCDTGAR